MIKFFRKIRLKALLPDGKAGSRKRFTKYFTYALGEIILVVIGILIALWINNKNQESQARKAEVVLIHQIIEDLEKDAKAIEAVLPQIKRKEQLPVTIYNEITHNPTTLDSTIYGEITWQVFLTLFFEQKHLASIENLSNREDRKKILDYLNVQNGVVFNMEQANSQILNKVRPLMHPVINTEHIMNSDYLQIRDNKSKFIDGDAFVKLYDQPEFNTLLIDLRMTWVSILYRVEELLSKNRELASYFTSSLQ